MLEVLAKGPLATVQDRGRPGYAHLGVPRSGALDPPALERANRLVGNPSTAAGLELSLGRFKALFHASTSVAVTGAVATVLVDGEKVPTSFAIEAGQQLEIGAPSAGVHCYLAVQGGIEVPMVLGSRSTDTLSGLGPAPLQVGDRLPFGASFNEPARATPAANYPDEIRIRVRFGPRDDWFRSPEELTFHPYRMGMANRLGARLTGPQPEPGGLGGVAQRGSGGRCGSGAGRWAADHLPRGSSNHRRVPGNCRCSPRRPAYGRSGPAWH